jgi:hypothetical protein
MPDARCTRGLVCEVVQRSCTRAYRAAENIRHSLRNGFTAYVALTPGYRAFMPPSPADSWLICTRSGRFAFHRLGADHEAPDPHDFAVRFGTARLLVLKTAHGVYPALQSFSAHDAATSTAILSQRSVTMANAPCSGTGWREFSGDLPFGKSEILPDGLIRRRRR